MKNTPNKFERMDFYWGGECFFRLIEAITIHSILDIQDNEYKNISSVSDDQFSGGVDFNDSFAMRVLKTPKYRPLGIILIIKIYHHYSNLILPPNSDSRCFKFGKLSTSFFYK